MKNTATLGQIKKILSLLEKISFEQVQSVLEQGTLTDILEASKIGSLRNADRDDIRELLGLTRLNPKPTVIEYTVPVNYNCSVTDLVVAGRYDWSDGRIHDKHFPSSLSLETNIKNVAMATFHFGRDLSSKDVIMEMKKMGYSPTVAKETLAFGEKNPDIQREYPILGLGSVAMVIGSRHVLYLCEHDLRRELRLVFFRDTWDGGSRFLAVRD